MVECGSISERPSPNTKSVFTIIEIVCIIILLVATAGSLFEFIKHFDILPHIPGLASFVADACMIAGLVFIIVGYWKNNDLYLKISFVCFLILIILDLFVFCWGMKEKFNRAYLNHIVRVAAEIYIVVALYFQVIKGSSGGSAPLVSSSSE